MSRWIEERFVGEFDLADIIPMLNSKKKGAAESSGCAEKRKIPSVPGRAGKNDTSARYETKSESLPGPSRSKQFKFFRSKTPSVEIVRKPRPVIPVIPPIPTDPLRFSDPFLLLSSSDSPSSLSPLGKNTGMEMASEGPAPTSKTTPLGTRGISKKEQPSYNTSWYERAPLSDPHISEACVRVSRENDGSVLLHFAGVLLSSLGKESSDGDIKDDDVNSCTAGLLQLLELTLDRLDVLDAALGGNNVNMLSLLNDILQHYVLGTINFNGTLIPEYIGKFHTAGLAELLDMVYKSGDPALLLPVCSENHENMMTILNYFANCSDIQRDQMNAKSDISAANPYLRTNASKLVAKLLRTLAAMSKVNALPPAFQTLVTFEYMIQAHLPALFIHKETTKALCNILDSTLYQCAKEDVDKNLVNLMFAALQNTARLLTNPSAVSHVNLTCFPHLQKFLEEVRVAVPRKGDPVNCPFIKREAEVSGDGSDDCTEGLSPNQHGTYLLSILDQWSPSPILGPSSSHSEIPTSSDEAKRDISSKEVAEKISSPKPREKRHGKWRRILTPASSTE